MKLRGYGCRRHPAPSRSTHLLSQGEATVYASLQALVNLCKSEPVLCVLLSQAVELGNEYDEDGEGIYADPDDDEDGEYADTIAECRVVDALSACMHTVIGQR